MKAWLFVNLWQTIRDFYVEHVWGGVSSTGTEYHSSIGRMASANGGNLSNTESYFVPLNGYNLFNNSQVGYLAFSDWLSTTSTIITLIIIVALCFFFIWRLFKFVSGALLLK